MSMMSTLSAIAAVGAVAALLSANANQSERKRRCTSAAGTA